MPEGVPAGARRGPGARARLRRCARGNGCRRATRGRRGKAGQSKQQNGEARSSTAAPRANRPGARAPRPGAANACARPGPGPKPRDDSRTGWRASGPAAEGADQIKDARRHGCHPDRQLAAAAGRGLTTWSGGNTARAGAAEAPGGGASRRSAGGSRRERPRICHRRKPGKLGRGQREGPVGNRAGGKARNGAPEARQLASNGATVGVPQAWQQTDGDARRGRGERVRPAAAEQKAGLATKTERRGPVARGPAPAGPQKRQHSRRCERDRASQPQNGVQRGRPGRGRAQDPDKPSSNPGPPHSSPASGKQQTRFAAEKGAAGRRRGPRQLVASVAMLRPYSRAGVRTGPSGEVRAGEEGRRGKQEEQKQRGDKNRDPNSRAGPRLVYARVPASARGGERRTDAQGCAWGHGWVHAGAWARSCCTRERTAKTEVTPRTQSMDQARDRGAESETLGEKRRGKREQPPRERTRAGGRADTDRAWLGAARGRSGRGGARRGCAKKKPGGSPPTPKVDGGAWGWEQAGPVSRPTLKPVRELGAEGLDTAADGTPRRSGGRRHGASGGWRTRANRAARARKPRGGRRLQEKTGPVRDRDAPGGIRARACHPRTR